MGNRSYDFIPDDVQEVSESGTPLDFVPGDPVNVVHDNAGEIDEAGEAKPADPVALVTAGYCPYCDTVKFVVTPERPLADSWPRLRSHIRRVHKDKPLPQPKV